MSHIDSFKHELVGLFGGLPVYHPLENIDGDFESSPSQLVLGGGDGEHPALIIKNPVAAVARFLFEELNSVEDSEGSILDFPLKQHLEAWRAAIDPHHKWWQEDNLEFCDWSVSTHKQFYYCCTSDAMPNPYDEESGCDLEVWFILGIGEFVFFAMPELASEIIDQLEDPYQYFFHMRYNNILLVPKNMPVYANGGNAFKFK